MVRRKKLISRDLELEILRDYIEESYPSIKEQEESDDAEIIKEFKTIKEKELYGEGFE